MYKSRCSTLGAICPPKGFAKSGQTLVQKQVKDIVYGRHFDVRSKYLSKGNICEIDAIMLLSEIKGQKLEKNEKRFENDLIAGTPDLIITDEVLDIKNSFTHETFPLFDSLPYDNELQLKGYMWLLGLTKGSVEYFLLDMPDELITKEAYYVMRDRGMDELETDLFMELKEKYTYSNLPLNLRHKSFPVELTDKDIDWIIKNVTLANDYGNSLLKEVGYVKS